MRATILEKERNREGGTHNATTAHNGCNLPQSQNYRPLSTARRASQLRRNCLSRKSMVFASCLYHRAHEGARWGQPLICNPSAASDRDREGEGEGEGEEQS